jgi:hypothetical protein
MNEVERPWALFRRTGGDSTPDCPMAKVELSLSEAEADRFASRDSQIQLLPFFYSSQPC